MTDSKLNRKTTVINENQKFILSQLRTRQHARFKELQPPKISSNTFSYHLKELQKGGWVVKTGQGYTLGPAGLAHIERDTLAQPVRMQPNVSVALIVQDGYGKILLHKKTNQPFIDQWELPTLPATVADTSVQESGVWAAKKLLHLVPGGVRHVGDCYVRIHKGKLALSATLVHVIRFDLNEYAPRNNYQWVDPLDVAKMPHVPGLEQIMARAFFNDDFFFEEYTVQMVAQPALGL